MLYGDDMLTECLMQQFSAKDGGSMIMNERLDTKLPDLIMLIKYPNPND